MTPLDQAFIKAYTHQGVSAAARESARPVPLSEALATPNRPSSARPSREGVLAALSRVPERQAVEAEPTSEVDAPGEIPAATAAPRSNAARGHRHRSTSMVAPADDSPDEQQPAVIVRFDSAHGGKSLPAREVERERRPARTRKSRHSSRTKSQAAPKSAKQNAGEQRKVPSRPVSAEATAKHCDTTARPQAASKSPGTREPQPQALPAQPAVAPVALDAGVGPLPPFLRPLPAVNPRKRGRPAPALDVDLPAVILPFDAPEPKVKESRPQPVAQEPVESEEPAAVSPVGTVAQSWPPESETASNPIAASESGAVSSAADAKPLEEPPAAADEQATGTTAAIAPPPAITEVCESEVEEELSTEEASSPSPPPCQQQAIAVAPAAPLEAAPQEVCADDPPATIPLLLPKTRIDTLRWPEICDRLLHSTSREIDAVCDGLLLAMSRGQRVFGFAGIRRGDGATTVLLCAARRLTSRGIRVAIADGDWAQPAIGQRLGVARRHGWEAVIAGSFTVSEAAVSTSASGLVLLPSFGSPPAQTPNQRAQAIVESLRTVVSNANVVLVDLGVATTRTDGAVASELQPFTAAIDAVVLVQDLRHTTELATIETERAMQGCGFETLGVVQNFVRD
ncbi:MAG: hypothetical protein ACOY3P_06755 [Planctomycetota bacterium]